MTCRDEVLVAFDRLQRRHGGEVFDLSETLQEVLASESTYSESTIRTSRGVPHVIGREATPLELKARYGIVPPEA